MTRKGLIAITLALVLCPGSAFAFTYLGFGLSVDAFAPMDRDLWGAGMADLRFSDTIGVPDTASQYLYPSRETLVFSPVFAEFLKFDNGFDFEFSQQIGYLYLAPNKELDIVFDRLWVPLRLTVHYTFLKTAKVRPFVGLGGGFHYMVTRVSGKDFEDRRKNPDYGLDDSDDNEGIRAADDDERAYFSTNREFGESGWFPGGHALAGVKFMVTDDFALRLAARYEMIFIDSFEVNLVDDGEGQWHWTKEKRSGNAGGFGLMAGFAYAF